MTFFSGMHSCLIQEYSHLSTHESEGHFAQTTQTSLNLVEHLLHYFLSIKYTICKCKETTLLQHYEKLVKAL